MNNPASNLHRVPTTMEGKELRHVWPYLSPLKQVTGVVARYDDLSGKIVMPFFVPNGTGLKPGAPKGLRPLFGLEFLAARKPESSVFITEGERCAGALQSLGLAAVTSLGGSGAAKMSDWSPLEGVPKVYLLPDNDSAGERYITDVAHQLSTLKRCPELFVVRLPNLGDKGDVIDWLMQIVPDWDGFVPIPEEHRKNVKARFREAIEVARIPWDNRPGATSKDWPEPSPLASDTIPDWPKNIYPAPIQDFVEALSTASETPIELASLVVLSILGAVGQGKYEVEVKQGYREPLSIWVFVGMPPGTRKTQVFKAAIAPLISHEASLTERLKHEIARAQSDLESGAERIKMLRRKYANGTEEDRQEIQKEIEDLEFAQPIIPRVPQLVCGDITPEGLGQVMAENDQRIAIINDEAGIFETIAGRYSGGVANLDAVLKGHANSPIRINRAGKAPIIMDSPHLTFGLAVQPETLEDLFSKPGFRGRGFIARFLFALPKSNLGFRTGTTPPVSDEIKKAYGHTITSIVEHEGSIEAEFGEVVECRDVAHVIKLSEEAYALWFKFSQKTELELREGGRFEDFADWAGKLPGAVARIAGLLHIARFAGDRPANHQISEADMGSAIAIADILEIYAHKVFVETDSSQDIRDAKKIAAWIKRNGLKRFTLREAHSGNRTRRALRTREEVEVALAHMVEWGWIRLLEAIKASYRPSEDYEVNPKVLK